MSILKEFEIEVLQRLGGRTLSPQQVVQLSVEGEFVSLNFTGVGYFLTLQHSILPKERVVMEKPILSGKVGDLLTGFVAFSEDGKVTLECFSYGIETVPQNFRDLDVRVTEQAI